MSKENGSQEQFIGKVRVRVCGILEEEGKILLLKHQPFGPAGYLWLPPGGGVEFGDTLEETLRREFLEETHLNIEIEKYLFSNEFITNQLHALEHFYLVKRISGQLKLGKDPELNEKNQLIKDVSFFSKEDLNRIPANAIHNAFNAASARDKIAELRGFISFKH